MILQKNKCLVLLIFIVLGVNLKADIPYKGSGQLDAFSIYLKNNIQSSDWERVIICMDNSMDADCNYAQGDAQKMPSPETFYNMYIIADDNGDYLFKKYKPYSNFYVDFKVGVILRVANPGPFTFSIQYIVENKAMKVVQIIDKEKPESEWVNVLTGDYTFTLPGVGTYDDRFIIRVYGADIPKLSSTPLPWNSASSWQSGFLPQSNSHVHILSGASLTTTASDNINIELLTTLGSLENNGSLSVDNLEFF